MLKFPNENRIFDLKSFFQTLPSSVHSSNAKGFKGKTSVSTVARGQRKGNEGCYLELTKNKIFKNNYALILYLFSVII